MTNSEPAALRPGLTGTATLATRAEHSARHVGSGSLEVLASPVMAALMEAAAVNCVESGLAAGQTSVGTRLDIAHQAATPIGMSVRATATLKVVDRRRLVFDIEAHDEAGPIGRGQHERMVVDAVRFLEKLQSKSIAGP